MKLETQHKHTNCRYMTGCSNAYYPINVINSMTANSQQPVTHIYNHLSKRFTLKSTDHVNMTYIRGNDINYGIKTP